MIYDIDWDEDLCLKIKELINWNRNIYFFISRNISISTESIYCIELDFW